MKASKPFNLHSALIGVATATLTLFAPFAIADTETYNTPGTTNWLCPNGVTSIQVECWGGGGAGGAGAKQTAGTNTSQNGGGGGGGAYARRTAVPVTPGQSYTITIPAAAVSGTNGLTNGQGRVNGGTVTFVGDGSVTVTAAGGTGGAVANSGASNSTNGQGGGAGGTTAASVGDFTFAGGTGSAGNTGPTSVPGSGGGGAGDANAGGGAVTNAAVSPNTTTPGAGGLVGGGAGGQGRGSGNGTSYIGLPGTTPGGGGAGAKNCGNSTTLGGDGGLGQMVLTYTIPPNFKANNETALNDPLSWTAFVPSGSIAKWDATVTAANTTSLGGDLTFSGISILDPGGLVTINTGNTLTLGAAPVDIDLSAATRDLTINCNLTMGAANVWNVQTGRTATLGGVVSGSAAVTKQGAGTVLLSGANTYTGSTNVTGGTLDITGSITGLPASSKLNVAPAAGNAVVNYNGGTSTLYAVTGANVAGTSSVFNMTAGNVTISPGNTTGTQSVAGAGNGAGVGAYGCYNITGGTFKDTNRFTVTSQATGSPTSGPASGIHTAVVYVGGTGTIDQTNGEWWLNYSLGQITVADSGTIDRTGSTSPFGIFMNHAAGVTGGGYGVLNLAGSNAQVITGTQPIRFGNSNTAGQGEGQSGFVNLAAGTLSVGANANTSLPAAPSVINNAYFNFAGGTVKATAALSGWIPTSSASINFNSNIFGPIDNSAVAGAPANFTGGLTLDTNGFAVAIANPLLAAGGVGVTQADLSVSGGSGYVGPPAVIFSSTDVVAGGTPAAGYALVSGGAITGIVITSPGTYTAGTTPTVTLIGGGGTGASVTAGALSTLNTSGGLTKIGGGTLTLSGANTYTGATTVSNGTLKSSTAGSAATDITVAGGAAGGVLVATTDGQWVNSGDLTLSNNSTLLIDYGSTAPSTTVAPIKVDNLVLGTNLGLKVEGSLISSLAANSSYRLVTWTTNGPADGSAFATILTPRLNGTFSVSDNTLWLDVTSNGAGQPISWNTGDGTWDTVTTNWLDASPATTTYVDLQDGVAFGDAVGATGNPTITLNSTLSPAGVTMKSTSHDYTITGTGGIGGTGGLTLDATNTRTLTLATTNTYTGATAINGGILKLSGAGTLGSSTVAVSSGALLDLNGTNQTLTFAAGTGVGTVANNSGSGTSTLTLSGTPSINISYVTIQDNTNTSSGKVAVVITGNTQGPSNLNSYSGGTTVNAGAYFYLSGGAVSGAGTGTINLLAYGGTGATSSGLLVDGGTYANDITGAGYLHINGASAPKFTGNLTTSGPFIFRTGTTGSYEFAGNGTTSTLSGVIGSTTSMVNGAVATGSIIKSGTGTLTLSGASVYTGGTTLSGGTLIANSAQPMGTSASPLKLNGGTLDLQTLGTAYNTIVGGNTTVLSNNATAGPGTTKTLGTLSIGAFQLDVAPGANATGSTAAITFGNTTLTGNATVNVAANSTLNLNGTVGGAFSLTVSGPGNVVFGSASTGALSNSGGLVINNGSNAFITNNNLISGTIPLTVDGSLTNGAGEIFGVLNGSGTINQVSNSLFTNSSINGTFSGSITGAGNYIKQGTSTQTLTGINTYTGNTTVSAGTLVLADNAQLKFVLGSVSGTNNKITGAGTVTLDGDFFIDTSAADALSSGTWLLEDVTALTGPYGATFSVIGFTDAGSDTWTKTVGNKKYTFDEETGTLTLATAGYASWIDGFFPGETNPLIIGVDADPDNDGIKNGVEMVIGGNPATGMDTALLPTIELVTDPVSVPAIPAGNYLLFTYRRSDLSVAGGVTADCETDTDLVAPWTPATGAPGVVIQVDDNFTFSPPATADTDRVRVYVPRGANAKLFGRLNIVVP